MIWKSLFSSFFLGFSLCGLGFYIGNWFGWFLGLMLALSIIIIKEEILSSLNEKKKKCVT